MRIALHSPFPLKDGSCTCKARTAMKGMDYRRKHGR
jgi:hypothetical protein